MAPTKKASSKKTIAASAAVGDSITLGNTSVQKNASKKTPKGAVKKRNMNVVELIENALAMSEPKARPTRSGMDVTLDTSGHDPRVVSVGPRVEDFEDKLDAFILDDTGAKPAPRVSSVSPPPADNTTAASDWNTTGHDTRVKVAVVIDTSGPEPRLASVSSRGPSSQGQPSQPQPTSTTANAPGPTTTSATHNHGTRAQVAVDLNTRGSSPQIVSVQPRTSSSALGAASASASGPIFSPSTQAFLDSLDALTDHYEADSTLFTFGLELELLITVPTADLVHNLPAHTRTLGPLACARALAQYNDDGDYQHHALVPIITYLRASGIAVNSYDEDKDTMDLGAWTIAREDLGMPDQDVDGASTTVTFELKTPALPYTAESLQHVAHVMGILDEQFNISTNDACTLHVHVGLATATTDLKKPKQIPWPVQTLKNLATAHILFQDQIDAVAPRHITAAPLAECFAADSDMPTNIRNLLAVRSKQAFLDVTGFAGNDKRDYALNFMNLQVRARYKTVEFRSHGGCFDVEDAGRWVQMSVGMVRWAARADVAETGRLCWLLESWLSNGTSAGSVLRYFGLPEDCVTYYEGEASKFGEWDGLSEE